jgi:hypothetical protein
MGALESQPDDDGFAHGPKVVELPVHVGKGRSVISDGIIPLVGSPVGDTDRLVGEDAVIGEESFPTFEIHSLRDRICVSNKALGVDSAAPIGHGFLLGFL